MDGREKKDKDHTQNLLLKYYDKLSIFLKFKLLKIMNLII